MLLKKIWCYNKGSRTLNDMYLLKAITAFMIMGHFQNPFYIYVYPNLQTPTSNTHGQHKCHAVLTVLIPGKTEFK